MRRVHTVSSAVIVLLVAAYFLLAHRKDLVPQKPTASNAVSPAVLQANLPRKRLSTPAKHKLLLLENAGDWRDRATLQTTSVQWAKSAGFRFPAIPRLPTGHMFPVWQARKHNASRLVGFDGKRFDVGDRRNVIVLVHIQKTAGTTLNRLLTERVTHPSPCTCGASTNKQKPWKVNWRHCKCYHPGQQSSGASQWLFSRTTTGWGCGLHPGFTDLAECLAAGKLHAWDHGVATATTTANGRGARSFFFITILRRPLDRFVSELAHVRRGATWKNTTFRCNGVTLRRPQIPLCYSGQNWQDVKLADFCACPYNMAVNRQTRMLANLSRVGCSYDNSMAAAEYNYRMLESAKRQVRSMAWFGLTEYLNESMQLFEHRFGMTLLPRPLEYSGNGQVSKSAWLWKTFSQDDIRLLRLANFMDIKLYDFAKKIFLQRYAEMLSVRKMPPKVPIETPVDETLFNV